MEVLPVTGLELKNNDKCAYTPDFTDDIFEFCGLEYLTQLLNTQLKSAKSNHLACGEVLLPADLLTRIAQEIYKQSESEPCGIRGCHVYIVFDFGQEIRTLTDFSCDSELQTPATFELYLTLKQTSNGWNAFLPQFLKKIARGGTVMISPDFQIVKNKLYRSYSE